MKEPGGQSSPFIVYLNYMDRRIFVSGGLYSVIWLLLSFPLLFSCTFDYGNQDSSEKDIPDIVMENVEYVRVRSADPQARVLAEKVERYEDRRKMDLYNFSFEQFGNSGKDVNAFGRGGSASFEIDSGNMRMDDGIRIDIDSEDISIETKWLEWKDNDKTLASGKDEEVSIFQNDGTTFTGIGFSANARQRTWDFTEGVSGTYIHKDKDNKETAEETDEGSESSEEKDAVE